MLSPVAEAYRAHNALEATVVIRADNYEEAASAKAKNMAIDYAKERGNKATGYGGTSSPYPCNKDGKTTDELLKGKEPVDHYRIDIRVNSAF